MLTLYGLMAKLHLRELEPGEKRKTDSSAAPISGVGGKCAESNGSSSVESRSDSEGSDVFIKGSTLQTDSLSGREDAEK